MYRRLHAAAQLTLRDVPDAITALVHGDVAPLAEDDLVGLDGSPVATDGAVRLVLLAPFRVEV